MQKTGDDAHIVVKMLGTAPDVQQIVCSVRLLRAGNNPATPGG